MYAFPSVCVPRPHPSVHSIGATAAQLRTKAPAPPPPSAHVTPFAVILVTVMCCLVAAERLRFPLGGIDDGVSPTPQHDEPSATATHINTDRSFPRDVCGGFAAREAPAGARGYQRAVEGTLYDFKMKLCMKLCTMGILVSLVSTRGNASTVAEYLDASAV